MSMSGSVLACAMFAACVAPMPADQAPAPRLVKPDASLIVLETVDVAGQERVRVKRIGFSKGRMLPPVTVCEVDFVDSYDWHHLVSDRFLVTSSGGVIDLRENKVVNAERDGEVMSVGAAGVTYTIESKTRESGVFVCEYATGNVSRVSKVPARTWYAELSPFIQTSPDNTKAVQWRNGDELILHREFGKPGSLGKGFRMSQDPKKKVDPALHDWTPLPMLWLDNEQFLTQRDHGQLVTVDLAGKVAEVVTVKDVPKFGHSFLSRGGSGAINYAVEREHFVIDVAKKTAVKSDWEFLGHGFEMSWEKTDKKGHKLRFKGQDIGQQNCWSTAAVTSPGYLAVPPWEGEDFVTPLPCVMVWSAATGDWTKIEFELEFHPLVGWIK